MQTAHVMLAIAGDPGNSVRKHNVTPAEIAVLREIHGEDSVTDIEPAGEVERTHREERQRLNETYGKVIDGANPVARLFPGAAARVFETLDELELDESLFKAEKRVSTQTPPKKASEPKRSTRKAKAEPEPENEDPADVQSDKPGTRQPAGVKERTQEELDEDIKAENEAAGKAGGAPGPVVEDDEDDADAGDGIEDMDDDAAKEAKPKGKAAKGKKGIFG